jgi:cytochrome c556
MCSLAEITGGQAVALSSAKNLADVIINGSAEEISLTHLSREVEEEIERVQAMDINMDEAQVFQQAAMNLQSRCVTSKHMRHDGAMSQAAPEVWSKATSLRAAKAELCSKYKEPEDDFRSLDMDTMGCAVKSMSLSASSGVFKKSAKRSSTGKERSSLMSSMTSWFRGGAKDESEGESGEDCEDAPIRRSFPGKGKAKGKGASIPMPGPVASMAAMPAAVPARSMPASMPVKTLAKNVLEEDVISLEQVARIGRKSACRKAVA